MSLSGRWTSENRAALQDWIARPCPTPRVAVLDWDNTCISGDLCDTVFHTLSESLLFNWESRDTWDWLDQSTQGDRIRAAQREYARAPSPESRQNLRYALEWVRDWMYRELDDTECLAWENGVFIGWTPAQVTEFTQRVITRELGQPRRNEILAPAGQPPLKLEWGFRERVEMKELAACLAEHGWQVWVISASPRWEVAAFAARYGLPLDRVLGTQRALDSQGRFSPAIIPPLSYDAGKVAAYRQFISRQRPPLLMAGDSDSDWLLLEYCEGLRLLVNPRRDRLIEYARWRASLGEPWLIQEFREPEEAHA